MKRLAIQRVLWLLCLLAVAGATLSFVGHGVVWSYVMHTVAPAMTPKPSTGTVSTAPSDPRERARRVLAHDQQCVAGTVVTVRPGYAQQMLKDGRVVHCHGRYADQPLR